MSQTAARSLLDILVEGGARDIFGVTGDALNEFVDGIRTHDMSINDFVTAVRHQWPIKVLLFNNGEHGFVKMEMEVAVCQGMRGRWSAGRTRRGTALPTNDVR